MMHGGSPGGAAIGSYSLESRRFVHHLPSHSTASTCAKRLTNSNSHLVCLGFFSPCIVEDLSLVTWERIVPYRVTLILANSAFRELHCWVPVLRVRGLRCVRGCVGSPLCAPLLQAGGAQDWGVGLQVPTGCISFRLSEAEASCGQQPALSG